MSQIVFAAAALLLARPLLAGVAPGAVVGADSVSGGTVKVALTGPGAATKATVVAFLSARCPCSASHETALKDLSRDFSGQGFRFVGVHANADEPAELSRAHFTGSALPFPVVEDDGAKLADELGAIKTPHVFVVAPTGEILFQGGVDDSHIAAAAKQPYLRNALAAVSAGRSPDPAEVRALGCVIKRP